MVCILVHEGDGCIKKTLILKWIIIFAGGLMLYFLTILKRKFKLNLNVFNFAWNMIEKNKVISEAWF